MDIILDAHNLTARPEFEPKSASDSFCLGFRAECATQKWASLCIIASELWQIMESGWYLMNWNLRWDEFRLFEYQSSSISVGRERGT